MLGRNQTNTRWETKPHYGQTSFVPKNVCSTCIAFYNWKLTIPWMTLTWPWVLTFSDLEWLTYQDASHDLLVALHPPYSLVLWNADTGTKLWKKSYTEPLLSFSFDPFNSKNVACKAMQGQTKLMFWFSGITTTDQMLTHWLIFYNALP